jgi:hypothetical protein
VRLRLCSPDTRRDDVDVMPAPARFTCEEVHVLTDAAEMRIVVLRHQRDAEATVVVRVGERRKIGERRLALERSSSGRWRHERHGQLVGRTRDNWSTKRRRAHSHEGNLTLLGSFPCSPQGQLRRCTLLPSVTATEISLGAWNGSRRRRMNPNEPRWQNTGRPGREAHALTTWARGLCFSASGRDQQPHP